jgi:hypothetical protein
MDRILPTGPGSQVIDPDQEGIFGSRIRDDNISRLLFGTSYAAGTNYEQEQKPYGDLSFQSFTH